MVSNLFNIIISAVRSKIMPLWIKLRMWFSPSFIKSKILVKIREFFVGLFDVKPRHKRDYYQIFGWMVSKRLAFALVIVLGLAAVFVITFTLPERVFDGGAAAAVDTYKYRSIPIKFHSGKVRILARDGYVAYEGEVSGGAANGAGVLYASDGSTVYDGEFADNKYNGEGTFYYPSGTPQYIGGFTDNIYNGKGTFYRENGTPEYSGDYDSGVRSGTGTLYNSVGAPVYQGNFVSGDIAFSDFLARPTSEVSALYSGVSEIYENEDEYCVVMPDIGAVYSVNDGSNTLESEWTVGTVYVMSDNITLDGKKYSDIGEIRNQLGKPLYFGTTWIDLPEAVAWKKLSEMGSGTLAQVEIDATEGLENVYAVSGYNRDFQIYIYSFEKDGLLYTFYFNEAGESEFLMYAIEKA